MLAMCSAWRLALLPCHPVWPPKGASMKKLPGPTTPQGLTHTKAGLQGTAGFPDGCDGP